MNLKKPKKHVYKVGDRVVLHNVYDSVKGTYVDHVTTIKEILPRRHYAIRVASEPNTSEPWWKYKRSQLRPYTPNLSERIEALKNG